MRSILLILILGLAAGCHPGGGAVVSNPVIDNAIVINNKTVAALRELQESTRQIRKEALELIARTAPSVEAGEKKMDALDARHKKLVALLERADTIQNALADLLDAAQGQGAAVDIEAILRTYAAMQALYAELTKEAATWTR